MSLTNRGEREELVSGDARENGDGVEEGLASADAGRAARGDGGEGLGDGQWERFHFLSPTATVLRLWVALIAVTLWFSRDRIEEQGFGSLWDWLRDLTAQAIGWALLGFLAVNIVLAIVAFVVWRFKVFSLAPDGIHMKSGVLNKKHIHIRWDRVQSVEVERKFLARVAGLGAVAVESAATTDGILRLGLLTEEQCEGLREAILKAADDARSDRPVTILPWRDGPSEQIDDPHIYELKTGRLLASLVLSPSFFLGVLSIFGSVALLAIDQKIALLPVLFIVFGVLGRGFGVTAGKWGAKLYLSPNGLRLRSGFASIKATTILPARVQAIRVRQRFLWRGLGWWSLEAEAASSRDDASDDDERIIELVTAGDLCDVERVMWALIPDLGVDDPAAFLKEAFEGRGPSEHFVAAPRASRILDPFGWVRNAVAFTRTIAVLRWGRFFGRSLRIVWHARFQGLKLTQGLVQRPLDLASLQLSTAAHELKAVQKHLSLADARSLCEWASQMGRDRRAVGDRESIEMWRWRLGLVGFADPAGTRLGRDGAVGQAGEAVGQAAGGAIGQAAGERADGGTLEAAGCASQDGGHGRGYVALTPKWGA